MTGTVLVIGGTGSTGQPLIQLLHKAGISTLVTSRSGKVSEPFRGVAFDWLNASTFENPFKLDASIDRVYIVSPPILDPAPIVKPFIDLAISKGVRKFVLLSATVTPPGGPMMGKIHDYLIETGVEFVALRPTWFMQNFVNQFGSSIKQNNQIYSVAGDSRIPFVSVEDIAQAAFEALTTDKITQGELFVVGPELFSYDQAAELLSKVLGREIMHKPITRDEHRNIFASFGVPAEYAYTLSGAEERIADGTEVDAFNAPDERKWVGKTTLGDFFINNKAAW